MSFPLVDGWPWGWGAIRVDIPENGWLCPDCGWKAKRRKDGSAPRGQHRYLFGGERCSICAKAWCERNWPPRRRLADLKLRR